MTRREMLLKTGLGFGAVALASLLEAAESNPLAPKPPHAPAKAKNIIYLFMHGGVSHVDTFDPKPELARHNGQPLSVELASLLPELGLLDLGESRPQELWRKAAALPATVRWHLLGHLQRNKIERTLPLVHLLHSVDSIRLLAGLEENLAKQGRTLDVLPQFRH